MMRMLDDRDNCTSVTPPEQVSPATTPKVSTQGPSSRAVVSVMPVNIQVPVLVTPPPPSQQLAPDRETVKMFANIKIWQVHYMVSKSARQRQVRSLLEAAHPNELHATLVNI